VKPGSSSRIANLPNQFKSLPPFYVAHLVFLLLLLLFESRILCWLKTASLSSSFFLALAFVHSWLVIWSVQLWRFFWNIMYCLLRQNEWLIGWLQLQVWITACSSDSSMLITKQLSLLRWLGNS
jgi:hypothetical protein